MPESAEKTTISGVVSSVIYQNEENGYAVLRLDTGSSGVVTAVGVLPCIAPGESLELSGQWTSHAAHGEQFKAERAERRLPGTAAAIYEYLAFGGIKGIGPATARAIVDQFGADTLAVIEESPERLAELRGVTAKRAQEIGHSFRRKAGIRRLMEFLTGAGIRAPLAMRLYNAYGEDAMAAVKDNPYILAGEYVGGEFAEADALAISLGFDGDSPERVQAAAIFELTHNLDNGHAFIPRDKLAAVTAGLIEVGADAAETAIDSLSEQGLIVEDGIAGKRACYLTSVYIAEKEVADRISSMASEELGRGGCAELIAEAQNEMGVSLAEGQKRAVEMAAERRVMVLTGGPGTGKTTAVRAILTLFKKLKLETVLAAPTGRAAKRLSEVCSEGAQTVHRLLGAAWSDEAGLPVFQKNADDPLEADAVILDESSMVDITLLHALLEAMRPGCRLILVGDADQLPPVGPGSAFADIIRSGAVETVRLTEIFRQAAESRIVRNAHRINSGEETELENSGDFFFLRRRTPESTLETIVQLCAERLPKNMGVEPSQIQVLAPQRRSACGTVRLNSALQAAVNPPSEGKKEKRFGDFLFREGDRVMQIRNNYDIMWKKDGEAGCGAFNGDVGVLIRMDEQTQTAQVDYDGRIAEYGFDMLSELEPAFAITVHKAQGSEYPAVVFAATAGAAALMNRSVLYTAVTRAKALLIIVGDDGAVRSMIMNDKRQRRYSGLRYRLAK